MSLQTQIQNLATRIATECKAIRVAFASVTGDKATLTTVNKSTLVAAINELQSSLSGAAGISDTASDTSHTWSASKIIAELNAAKASIIDGAPAAYDTLLEIANKLASDDTATAGMLTAINNRVRFDAAQPLTAPQQLQARTNIGAVASSDIGNTETNFVTTFEAAL